jgi:hypothetical protein
VGIPNSFLPESYQPGAQNASGCARVGRIRGVVETAPTYAIRLCKNGEEFQSGNGHAMGIAAEIAQHLHGSAEGGFGIDDPGSALLLRNLTP